MSNIYTQSMKYLPILCLALFLVPAFSQAATFGYTTSGASFQRTTESISQPSANRHGNAYILGTAGTIDSIVARYKMEGGSDSAVTCSAFVNVEDSVSSGSHGETVQVERTDISLTTTATDYTFTAASEAFSATDLIVNTICNESTLAGGLAFGTAYDSVASTDRYDVNYEELYASTATADPWVATLTSGTTNRYTMYVNYTATGGEGSSSTPQSIFFFE